MLYNIHTHTHTYIYIYTNLISLVKLITCSCRLSGAPYWSGLRQLQCLLEPLEQFRDQIIMIIQIAPRSSILHGLFTFGLEHFLQRNSRFHCCPLHVNSSSNRPESAGVAIRGPVEDLVWICHFDVKLPELV